MVATDGIWEFLDNKMVKSIIYPYLKTKEYEKSAKKLAREARKIWKKEDFIIDDITVILVYVEFQK